MLKLEVSGYVHCVFIIHLNSKKNYIDFFGFYNKTVHSKNMSITVLWPKTAAKHPQKYSLQTNSFVSLSSGIRKSEIELHALCARGRPFDEGCSTFEDLWRKLRIKFSRIILRFMIKFTNADVKKCVFCLE